MSARFATMRVEFYPRMILVIVDRSRSDDRPDVEALFRRVFGATMADASAARSRWQHLPNPNAREPHNSIAREGSVVGQYAPMPFRLRVKLSIASHKLFRKLKWRDVGSVCGLASLF